MSKSKSESHRASNTLPTNDEQDVRSNRQGPASSGNSDWESLFKTHIELVQAHVTMLSSLMENMKEATAKKSESDNSKVLEGMKSRANTILEDAKRVRDGVLRRDKGKGRQAIVEDEDEEEEADDGSHATRDRATNSAKENTIKSVVERKRKADSEESDDAVKIRKKERGSTSEDKETLGTDASGAVSKPKRKASSQEPEDLPRSTKKERLTPNPPSTTPSAPQSSSRPIKIPKSPPKATNASSLPIVSAQPEPANTISTTILKEIDFTALHAQLQAEIETGMKLQAEKLAEEEKLKERNGEKKKRKRERDSLGYGSGDGAGEKVVIGKKVRSLERGGAGGDRKSIGVSGRKRKASGEVSGSGDGGIVIPVGGERLKKRKSGIKG